jgi:hypothetical protein
MFRLFGALWGDSASQTKSDGPEVLVSSQPSTYLGDSARIVDEENGRAYRTVVDDGTNASNSGVVSVNHGSNNEDGDPDDKHTASMSPTTVVNGQIVITEKFENEQKHSLSDDDDDSDIEDGVYRDDYYQDLSDEEPDSEFIDSCYEYLELSERCYAIRRVNSKRADILAHESTPLVAFCYALQRETNEQLAEVTQTAHSIGEAEFRRASQSNDFVPLGVIGWFVQNVMNDVPRFAFESEHSKEVKHVVDLGPHIEKVVNPASAASGNATGVALLTNGADFLERSQLAFEIHNGMTRQNAIDLLQFTFARQNLRRYDRRGQTAPINPPAPTVNTNATSATASTPSPATTSAEPAPAEPAFQGFSPVTATNGRWYVITATHYALFKSNELLVARSGASLARLSQILDRGTAIFSTPTPGCTQAQERMVLNRFLQSLSAQAERERDHKRTLMISTLRNRCGQLVGQLERMKQMKFQKPPFLSTESDEESMSYIIEVIEDVSVTLKQLEAEQMNSF